MRRVRIELGARSYDVALGSGLLADLAAAGAAAEPLRHRRVFVVSDRTVWNLHGARLERSLGEAQAPIGGRALLEPGEHHKTVASLSAVWDSLVEARTERSDCVVGFGGGVVGDVAGFAAATYHRGIDVVQVPTTLLAMVDSSVGGKTAVDHPGGKNLLGAFHQPRGVLADLDVLRTLPEREVRSGFAEVIKAALIGDPELFELLEERGPALFGDPVCLEEVLARSVAVKARIVTRDEREAGPRALLNLGHTVGHALETAAGFGTYSHGEAVAAGIAFAAALSVDLGILPTEDAHRIRAVLENFGYPLSIPGALTEKMVAAMRADKKSAGGSPRWVLLTGIGQGRWGVEIPGNRVRDALSEVLGKP